MVNPRDTAGECKRRRRRRREPALLEKEVTETRAMTPQPSIQQCWTNASGDCEGKCPDITAAGYTGARYLSCPSSLSASSSLTSSAEARYIHYM